MLRSVISMSASAHFPLKLVVFKFKILIKSLTIRFVSWHQLPMLIITDTVAIVLRNLLEDEGETSTCADTTVVSSSKVHHMFNCCPLSRRSATFKQNIVLIFD